MTNISLNDAFVAISQVKAAYCHALDTKDWDTYTSLFTQDYVLDLSEDTDMEPIRGRDAAMAYVRESVGDAITAHQIHVPLIELDGNEANVIFPLQDRLIWSPPKRGFKSMTGFGEYHERWVYENGAWKIAQLKLTRFHVDFEKAD